MHANRFVPTVAVLLLVSGMAKASPRDELLRVTPSDTALVLLVQNAREHRNNLIGSPFMQWLPSTAVGKKLLESAEIKLLRDSTQMIFNELGTTPAALLEDVLGEAVTFSFSPAPADRPNEERSLILIRPRKPEVLLKLIDKINDLQIRSGESKGVEDKQYAGVTYRERQKPGNLSEYFCFRGNIFAFSGNESEIKSFIDRDKTAAKFEDQSPVLLDRLKKLGISDAAAVILINPRALDGELKSKLASAKIDEKRFLTRFSEIWTALDSAGLYLTLDKNIELGVSVRFTPGKLPADARKWFTGPRKVTTAERLIPQDALFGIAGQVRAVELIEVISSLVPHEPGKPGVQEWLTEAVGPIVGRDKLPLVLDALGPNWAVWAEPPAKDGVLPKFVGALEISGEGESRGKSEKAILQAVQFGFNRARVYYNSNHQDQIEIKEEKDPSSGATITVLVNEKGFPPGFAPAYAIVSGYLVVATSPESIRSFDSKVPNNSVQTDYSTFGEVKWSAVPSYLLANAPHLAKFLADLSAGSEIALREQLEALASVLELIESAEVIARGDDNGIRLGIRVKMAKPLK